MRTTMICSCIAIAAVSRMLLGAQAQPVTTAPTVKLPVPLPTAVKPTLVEANGFNYSFAGTSFSAISFSRSAVNPTATPTSAGRPSLQSISFLRYVDAASPTFRQWLNARQGGTLTITAFKAGQRVETQTFANALLTSISPSSNVQGQPLETLVFVFSQMTITSP